MSVIDSLPYPDSVAALFQPFARRPWSIWLDSGAGRGEGGRYDIMVADPRWRISGDAAGGRVQDRDGREFRYQGDPLRQIRRLLGPRRAMIPGLPFAGGAVGYLSYDLGRTYQNLPPMQGRSALPLMAVGIYDWALVVDHQTREAMLVSNAEHPPAPGEWGALLDRLRSPVTEAVTGIAGFAGDCRLPDREAYRRAFSRIQQYIAEGDCYQVNFAQRFQVAFEGDPWALYRKFRRISPAPYSAYLNLPQGQVLCTSPEQFLQLRGGRVLTRPIKGTRPRVADPDLDHKQRFALRSSAKDRAENLMIVDLMRNDLGKVCAPGSIEVPELFGLRSFAQVHHLVSTVSGRLAEGRDALDLLRACLPGGSITGAPKHRAMQIIDELESASRGVYCGSILRIGFDGDMDSNIAIRTLTIAAGMASYWAGGGVVADSRADAEYQESLDKAAGFLRLLDACPRFRGDRLSPV